MVAAVLRDDIDWSKLPATTPDSVKRLLMRCLERDLKQRLQAIGEARVVLEEATGRSSSSMSAPVPSAPVPVKTSRRWLAAAAVIVLAIGAYAVWPSKTEPSSTAASTPAGRAIAVLPFVNSSGNKDDEYVADGMTDELIAGLGKVPGLHVAARSSAFSFKGQKVEIRDVAKKLGVDSILEGTVRRSGKRLRVTASLVNASDGLQLWSDTFEDDGGDPFAVQDKVTRGVVSGLSLRLAGTALAASQAGRTRDPEAHDLYLRGLASANAASEADLRRALEYYQQAIARDPGFAQAYAGIAWVHVFLADAYVPPDEAYPKAKAAAQAALERDSQLADAHALLAYSTGAMWQDQATVDREFKRAFELDPNSVNALLLQGSERCFANHLEEGLRALDRAAQLDPLSPIAPMIQEICNYFLRRYDALLEVHRRAQMIAPTFVYIESWSGAAYRELGDYEASLREYLQAAKYLDGAPQYGLALTYVRMGRQKEAREIMRQMNERARTQYVPFVSRAVVHLALGDLDAGVALLQQAVDHRESFIFALRNLPEMSSVKADPRVKRILEQVDAIRKAM
jgi:serine/threonine-protein kinase